MRVASTPQPIPKTNNIWLGKDSFLPQQPIVFIFFSYFLFLPPFLLILFSFSFSPLSSSHYHLYVCLFHSTIPKKKILALTLEYISRERIQTIGSRDCTNAPSYLAWPTFPFSDKHEFVLMPKRWWNKDRFCSSHLPLNVYLHILANL